MRKRSCILQTHSVENEELYQLTLTNHAKYAAAHQYDMVQLNVEYGVALRDPLSYILPVLEFYAFVFTIGSDVVITKMSVPFESFFQGEGVAVSLEDVGGSACNADTIAWGSGAMSVVELLEERRGQWQNHPWGMQEAFNQLLREESPLVRFAPLREMQSTHVKGFPRSMWQPGDFALHCLGASNDDKVRRIRCFLETGVVLWRD